MMTKYDRDKLLKKAETGYFEEDRTSFVEDMAERLDIKNKSDLSR